MLRMVLVLLGALVLSGLGAGSGIDRMARSDPAIARMVPDWFATIALRTLGGRALAAGRGADAAAYGWHAVNRAPTDAEAVALLAAGRLANGDRAGAQRAFAVAGRMGWRVPITQAYWFDRALAAKDYDAAVERLDALLRQQPTLVGQQGLLDRVEQNPEARAALIARLDPRTAWLGKYLEEVFALPPQALRQRATVLIEAARGGLVLGCDASASLAGAMANRGLYEEAHRFWRAECPPAGESLLGDAGFARLSLQGARSPFDWTVVGSGEISLGLVDNPAGQGRRLTVAGAPPVTQPILTRLLVLPRGRYRLSWEARDAAGRPSPRIRAALDCKEAPVSWIEPAHDQAARRWSDVIEVPANCPVQVLTFALAPGDGELLSLGEVSLRPQP